MEVKRSRGLIAVLCVIALPSCVLAQAALQPAQTTPPTLDEVRKQMGIPSQGDVRGQMDIVGFASTAAQMQKVWDLSAGPPRPQRLGEAPAGVAGVICPHDDYVYAGRVYRDVLPLVTAKTVVLVGVFHRYRKFGVHDVIVFDPYRAWRSPDGEIPVSSLREQVLAQLPATGYVKDAAMHDSEHSLEALAYWLKHARPDVEILPIIVPAAGFSRLQDLAGRTGQALAAAIKGRGWQLGTDVSIAISSDAVHYGADFKYTPFGEGGIETYVTAYDQDIALLRGSLAGPVMTAGIQRFYETCVNPENPNEYRLTWCGRFSIPFGMLLLERTAAALGGGAPVAVPLVYATSVGSPEIPIRDTGLGDTASANLYHFVGYPAVAFTVPKH